MNTAAVFSKDVLKLDAPRALAEIEAGVRDIVLKKFRRKGVVVGLSGGIDSSTVAALCVRALGPDKVFGIFMPESESSGESLALGQELAASLGIKAVIEDISPMLKGADCYRRRDEAIRLVLPEFNEHYKMKIVLSSVVNQSAYPVYSVVARSPEGKETTVRLSLEAYLGVVAATNFKQRARKMMEYYHADRLNFAVAGTPNLLEYDQGFFVKNGDGSADIKPIAHLYKTQVYQMAEYLGVPQSICRRPPTTDTYSLEQSQEEFFFSLPYGQMDLCLYAKDHAIPAAEASPAVGLPAEQVERVYQMIEAKRRATWYLHQPALLVGELPK